MTRFLKKLIMAGFGIAFLASLSMPSVSAESVNVSLPTFKITMNDVRIDNYERLYPIIVYKDITYVPMTYNDSRFLGLETRWNAETGLQVNKISEQISYNPNKGSFNSNLESAVLPNFRISVNGKDIDNNSETYPLLVFRDITYFPLTWRFMVDAFGWTSTFDLANGLVISSKAGNTGSAVPPTNEREFSRNFGATTVFFDRTSNQQPGNLYARENNRTKKIGNPNYIYGVSVAQSGRYGEYTSVDKVEYANRWVYTLAVDPSAYPVTSRNVRINIDTNEVQTIAENDNNSNGQFYSKMFNNITVMLDRSSNKQPGNLYVKINNNTKRVGNPNYIYGVSAVQSGRYGEYTAVDEVEYANRWIYTLAVDPSAYPATSKNVRINIDTNEVQTIDGNDNSQISSQVYSRQFNNITVMLDRASNKQTGNLYVKENNNTKRIGNSNYIYGVSYVKLFGFESYKPVDNISVSGRWVYTLGIDTSNSPLVSKNVRVNIDTSEVQITN